MWWRLGYGAATDRLKVLTQENTVLLTYLIQPARKFRDNYSINTFSQEEQSRATQCNKKAPGPYGIHAEVLKTIIVETYNVSHQRSLIFIMESHFSGSYPQDKRWAWGPFITSSPTHAGKSRQSPEIDLSDTTHRGYCFCECDLFLAAQLQNEESFKHAIQEAQPSAAWSFAWRLERFQLRQMEEYVLRVETYFPLTKVPLWMIISCLKNRALLTTSFTIAKDFYNVRSCSGN